MRSRAEPGEVLAPMKPSATGRTRATKGREQELIEVAARMFFDRGYDATSLADVADALGMLKGSLYYYIASKDDLLHEVILRQHRAALDLAQRCRRVEGTPRDRLIALVRGYERSLADEHVFVSVYLHDLDRLSPERRAVIVRERRAYVEFVVDTLREGRDAGQFRADLDPELAAQGVLGMLNSSYRWYRRGGTPSPARIVEEFLALILHGIDR